MFVALANNWVHPPAEYGAGLVLLDRLCGRSTGGSCLVLNISPVAAPLTRRYQIPA